MEAAKTSQAQSGVGPKYTFATRRNRIAAPLSPPRMSPARPHYLLQAETYRSGHGTPRWKFALQSVGGEDRLAASDSESTTRRSRLELLAVVRGLEALDRPARVTLLTRSRYVTRGLHRQLKHWRENHWQWERFGTMEPIRDYDLWRRIDRALEFHTVECCMWQPETTAERKRPPRAAFSPRRWSLSAALATVRRRLATPLAAPCRPSFTPAA